MAPEKRQVNHQKGDSYQSTGAAKPVPRRGHLDEAPSSAATQGAEQICSTRRGDGRRRLFERAGLPVHGGWPLQPEHDTERSRPPHALDPPAIRLASGCRSPTSSPEKIINAIRNNRGDDAISRAASPESRAGRGPRLAEPTPNPHRTPTGVRVGPESDDDSARTHARCAELPSATPTEVNALLHWPHGVNVEHKLL